MGRRTSLLRTMADEVFAGLIPAKGERVELEAIKIYRRRALPALLVAAVLAAGLLALVGAKPAWTAEPSFAPAPNSPFSAGTAPTTVTNADFDGDGKVDLVAQNSGSNSVSVLLGNGDGTFRDKQDFAVGAVPTAVTSAHFDDDNGDGKADSADFVDLAVTNQDSNNVLVLLGKGDGTFQDKQDFAVGSKPSSVVSADFNGDTKADLTVSNSASNDISVMLGNGNGIFGPAQPYSVSVGGSSPNQIITDDFDGTATWTSRPRT